MILLKGKSITNEKILVETVYNLEEEENKYINIDEGVVVDKEASQPTYKKGKGFLWYVNPKTKEQWFEEYDRPLTQEEQSEELQNQVNALNIAMAEIMGV